MTTVTNRDEEILEPFVGEWSLRASFPDVPSTDIGARASFEWLPGKRFLVQRWEVPMPEAPDGIAIIGADPASGGTFSEDGQSLSGALEIDRDGKIWEHDFDLDYVKIR